MGTSIGMKNQSAGGLDSRPPALELRNVSKTFGGVNALNSVNLIIEKGEIHGLVGENGSGKSTLIKILAGYYAPDTDGSELLVAGRRVKLPLSSGQFRQLGMSFVHQDLGLIPALTVLENLRIGKLSSAGGWHISWGRERESARKIFSEFGIRIDPMTKVSSLRPTDCARLAIVRAVEEMRSTLNGEGGVLVLDEPTVYLPAAGKRQLYELMRDIASRGASVLFVSHDLSEVKEITHKVTVLRNGYNQGTLRTEDASESKLINLIVGRQLDALVVQKSDLRQRPADIVLTSLSGGNLRKVDINFYRGEVLGLTGLAGFGFEEVPYLVFGAKKARSGSLLIDGQSQDLTRITPSLALKIGIGLLPADRKNDGSVGSLSVGDNVMLQVLDRYFKGLRLRCKKMMADAGVLLDNYDVRPRQPDMVYQTLSGGNQQKVLFAKWLQIDPKLLFLHEPTQGVDVGARKEIFRVVRASAEQGAAVVCVSTDYEVLAKVCDRVLIFGRSSSLKELSGDDISKDRIIEQCYAMAG